MGRAVILAGRVAVAAPCALVAGGRVKGLRPIRIEGSDVSWRRCGNLKLGRLVEASAAGCRGVRLVFGRSES